jgi:diguanylate cyclase (GGDEF)-like protein
VLSLYSKAHDAFTEDHQRIIEIVAQQLSPVLMRSVEYASTTQGSLKDPLTGLPNLDHLRQLSDEHAPGDLPVPSAIIYVEVNELTGINVSYGRGVGDQALRQIVGTLRSNLRAADVLFRLESDEFAVLLLQTSKETAIAVADRMRVSVQQMGDAGPNRMRVNVTLTVVASPVDGTTIDTLLEAGRRIAASRGTKPSSSSESIH